MQYSTPAAFLLAALATAVLAGCSSSSDRMGVWTKAEASPDQSDKDLRNCRAYADNQTRGDRGVDQDLAVMSGTASSGLNPDLNQNINAYGTAKRYDKLVRDCMTELGYHEVK